MPVHWGGASGSRFPLVCVVSEMLSWLFDLEVDSLGRLHLCSSDPDCESSLMSSPSTSSMPKAWKTLRDQRIGTWLSSSTTLEIQGNLKLSGSRYAQHPCPPYCFHAMPHTGSFSKACLIPGLHLVIEAQVSCVPKIPQIYSRIELEFGCKSGLLFKELVAKSSCYPDSWVRFWGEERSCFSTIINLWLPFLHKHRALSLSSFGFWNLTASVHMAQKFQTIHLWFQKPIFETWKTKIDFFLLWFFCGFSFQKQWK